MPSTDHNALAEEASTKANVPSEENCPIDDEHDDEHTVLPDDEHGANGMFHDDARP